MKLKSANTAGFDGHPDSASLDDLARTRGRVALLLGAVMIIVYFGFILLIAFFKEAMGRLVVPGLSIGIVLGALVIVVTWGLTWFYMRWASVHVDPVVRRLRGEER